MVADAAADMLGLAAHADFAVDDPDRRRHRVAVAPDAVRYPEDRTIAPSANGTCRGSASSRAAIQPRCVSIKRSPCSGGTLRGRTSSTWRSDGLMRSSRRRARGLTRIVTGAPTSSAVARRCASPSEIVPCGARRRRLSSDLNNSSSRRSGASQKLLASPAIWQGGAGKGTGRADNRPPRETL